MKVKAIMLCLLASIAGMQAQQSVPPTINTTVKTDAKGTLTGKVIDNKTKEPLPYVTITVKDDGKVISGSITKENGTFNLNDLPLKTLHIEIVFIGYAKFETTVNFSKEENTINLKNIALEEEAKQLNEVIITKDKTAIVQKIDRKIVTVGKDLQATGSTAADIMNNIPTVNVDLQNNTVSLRGNENVKILINGKPSNLTAIQALQQIPSTSIKQIELITNPSAKYNPEGMSGIINIVLNKNSMMGFNGNVNSGVVFGIVPKFNGSFDLNYKVNKFNFYSTYSLNHGKRINKGIVHWDKYNSAEDYDLSFKITEFNKEHFTKLGSDYYINDKNTVSFYTLQTFNSPLFKFENGVDYSNPATTDQLQIQNSTGKSKNQTYNLAFKHIFDKEEKTLDIELNYNTDKSPENSLYTDGNNAFLRKNNVTKNGKNFIGNIDFVNPINETTKVELGLESRLDETSNTFVVNDNFDADFNFERNIQSAYGNFSKQFTKWSYQLGLRLESYDVKGTFKKSGFPNETFTDYIFTAYPSAYLTYNPSENNSFNFNYSRRVDRPNMDQVNKIRQWSASTIEQIGNSELKPQFTNSIEANYTRKLQKGSITAGAFVRFIKDEINQVLTSNPYDPTKQLMTFTNFDKNQEYGLEVSGSYEFKKWWNVNFGVDNYFNNTRGIIEKRDGNLYEESIHASIFNSRMNHTFKVTKNFRLIWFTMYSGARQGLQFSNKDMWKTDLGSRLDLFEGKGSLSLRFNDIFKTMQSRFYSTEPANINGKFRWESQTVNLNFSYRFGSGKNKSLDRKQRDNNVKQGGGMF
ncbi:TonB-dependent outer membrane receptorprecursor [Flavobacterium cauense R2A-7]|uniref:Outer membrane receptor protein involved in Fe transport n=1 Tax=Flavobacterium cauense R2A-7 TaxID=1341154 RepID=V6RXT2_9FLAO|nr:outer membrane beta-barrel family protein [Flavobacterium cauense]ESU19258.1 TonB-dependent outer membrane receptorprecursor [Flavobacterium cauense R2A-7]KGO82124.1 TonB-dependent receptor [Flavobacterium cauense R2A-7]TWI15074.1 outer membrane receptor protein involved in Fe transport [Flavobacterium cauense R2A-7]